jgi:nucleoside-diphosphate-sugar epimerase
MSTSTASTKTIAFFGATGGCALSALRRSLLAGHQCIALCRTPSKLSSQFASSQYPNLRLVQGNAHDADAVAECLTKPNAPTQLVDFVVFSIGSRPKFVGIKPTLEDPHVCENGMKALVAALSSLRSQGATGSPLVVTVSTTGLSPNGRDYPVLLWPIYGPLLKVPHADKKAMEKLLVASGERCVVVRPSLLTSGDETAHKLRVALEDLAKGTLQGKKEIGYTISREDVGRWIFTELIQGVAGGQYEGKAVSVTL